MYYNNCKLAKRIALTQRNRQLQHGAASNHTKPTKRRRDIDGRVEEIETKIKKYIETLEEKIKNLEREKTQSLCDTRVVQTKETISSTTVTADLGDNLNNRSND